jgi:site-specific DNA-methyltransferase (adenine-specific)
MGMLVSDVYRKGPVELRLGSYLDVLGDVEPDAVITDPPYSERTSAGQWSGTVGCGKGPRGGGIQYRFVTPEWWAAWADRWLTSGALWCVAFGDHLSAHWALEAWAERGWYTFNPAIWVKTDAAPRLHADGPSPQHETIAIARPRRRLARAEKFYRPGWYQGGGRSGKTGLIGGKPPWLMRALVRDYSRPGDLVCDPCAGGATTLIAAALEGRRAIGAEIDPETYAKACARIERHALTPPLPGLERAPMDGTQSGWDL